MTPRRLGWARWRIDDSNRLLKLYQMHAAINGAGNLGVNDDHWKMIAEQFPGRTVTACKEQFRKLNNIASGKPPRERPRKSNPMYVKREDRQPPPRLPDPLSITAFVLGDPLPGRSALDRRRMQEAR